MKYLKWIVGLALFLAIFFVGFGFIARNSDVIAIKMLPSCTIEPTIAQALGGAFLSGLLVGLVLLSFSLFGQKIKTGSAKRQLRQAEKEVAELRAAESAAD